MANNATITRFRGDTAPDKVVVKDSTGAPVDITGYTFKLTVNSEKDPTATTNQKYQVVGVLVSPTTGVVWFTPSTLQADQAPGRYYYDVEMTDVSGNIETILKGTYKYKQDITKA